MNSIIKLILKCLFMLPDTLTALIGQLDTDKTDATAKDAGKIAADQAALDADNAAQTADAKLNQTKADLKAAIDAL